MSDVITKVKQQKISTLLTEGKRLDGRNPLDFREIKIETGLIEKASGSALVSMGKTKVLTGIKIETGTPYSDTPSEGVLTVNVELIPLASPSFEAGPPSEDAIELARVIDRGIRESKAIDLKKLCIISGKIVFVVFVDVYVLDHDGNLFDASALASILALFDSKLKNYDIKEEKIIFKDGFTKLPMIDCPIEVTIGKIENNLIVDPNLDEESALDARITIAINKEEKICAIQKGLTGTFTFEEIFKVKNLAKQKAKELREKYLGGVVSG